MKKFQPPKFEIPTRVFCGNVIKAFIFDTREFTTLHLFHFVTALTQSIKCLMDLHTCIRNGGGEAVVIGMDWICCCLTTEGTLLREFKGIPEFGLQC